MPSPPLRMGELVATLALAQDNAFGQPLESQLRSCLLGVWLAEEAGFEQEQRETVYWVALLRYIGCTGHAHEVATLFGDEIAIRAQTLVHDAANPAEVIGDVIAFATAGKSPEERDQIIKMIQEGARRGRCTTSPRGARWATCSRPASASSPPCGTPSASRSSGGTARATPTTSAARTIPLAMRAVHISHDMEAHGRLFSPAEAIETVRERRGRTYDPDAGGRLRRPRGGLLRAAGRLEPWDAVLELEPEPHRTLEGDELDEALTIVADFVDLKSPYMSGHSRRCAQLARDAARTLGLAERDVVALAAGGPRPRDRHDRRAELDLGQARSADARRVRPRRAPPDAHRADAAALAGAAGAEPGGGDAPRARRRLGLPQVPASGGARARRARARGHGRLRGAHQPTAPIAPRSRAEEAATELRRLAEQGTLDARAVNAVLAAAGHAAPAGSGGRRAAGPGGLTGREAEVLRLAARGLTTQAIADELYISPKTADHHIQHVYSKIGVSTRAAAALWAMQHALVA